MDFIKANIPRVGSLEDMVKVYALGSGSLYNTFKYYAPMVGSLIDDV